MTHNVKLHDLVQFTTDDHAAPGANLAAVVTYAATSSQYHAISGVSWSYDGAPTGGSLRIHNGAASTFLEVDITAAGPGSILFDPWQYGDKGAALVITLAAGGGGVSGKVTVLGHQVGG